MVTLVPDNAKTILEPTPGHGNIVKALTKKGTYNITAAEDFFLIDSTNRFDCIVMNPPFSSKHGFLENAPKEYKLEGMRLGYFILMQCMKMSDSVIAIMPWFTLIDSDVRMKELFRFGLKSVTSLPRKTFNYSRIQTIIIELQKGYNGITTFKHYEQH